MILLFQILKSDMYSDKATRFLKVVYSMLDDPSCLHSNLTELFLELLFNVIKNDYSLVRKCACVKKLLMNTMHSDPNVIIAVLLFLKLLATEEAGLNQLIFNKGNVNIFKGGDEILEEESSDSENEWDDEGNKIEKEDKFQEVKVAEEHGADKNMTVDEIINLERLYCPSSSFDFENRDPMFSNGDVSTIPELMYLNKHYHPSVQKITNKLLTNLANSEVKYDGNPLLDFNYTSFLARFCLKKPKKLNPRQVQQAE